jgi:hypothetical protein
MLQQQPPQTEEEEYPATPEEEAQLEQAIDAAMVMLHSEGKEGDNLAAMVLQSQDVAQGMGQALATIIVGVEKQLGGLEDAVKVELSEVVADELLELAIQAGAISKEEAQSDDLIDELVSQGYSQYLQIKESMGELDQTSLEASVNDAKTMSASEPQAKPQRAGLLKQRG